MSASFLPLAGFLALLALAIYTGVTVTFFGKRFLDWRFSWSYIIGWVAIILAFAAGKFFVFSFFSAKCCVQVPDVRRCLNRCPRCRPEVSCSGVTLTVLQVFSSCAPTSGRQQNPLLPTAQIAELTTTAAPTCITNK